MRPTTIRQARKYRYGKWAGNPDGNSYQEGYCIEEIFPNGRGAIHRQCGGRGKPWCSIHQPGAKEKRAANRPLTRFKLEMAAIDKRERDYQELRRLRKVVGSIANMPCTCGSGCAHALAKKAVRLTEKR